MLVGTYQGTTSLAPDAIREEKKRVFNIPEKDRNEYQSDLWKISLDNRTGTDDFGFSPVWLFPMPTLEDTFAKSVMTDACDPFMFFAYDIPENELVKIDALRHENKDYEKLTDLITNSDDVTILEYVVDANTFNNYEPRVQIPTSTTRFLSPFPSLARFNTQGLNETYADLNEDLFDFFDAVYIGEQIYPTVITPVQGINKNITKNYLIEMVMRDEFSFSYLPFLFEDAKNVKDDDCITLNSAMLGAVSRNMKKFFDLKSRLIDLRKQETPISYDEYKSVYDGFKSMVCTNIPVLTELMERGEPKRNEPCPCGSGKKWKQCHGKLRHKIECQPVIL